ncbi:DUF559 domain-containing protein [Microlunatus ginsengisoli]|uniref:DUF559 domain-containing protein n=1 Tax=Microlunatus ginsengisoli TaxID=363863 RepID=A0ABP7AEP0_9ACTN
MTFDPTVPFTRAEALAAGLTPATLAGPRYRRLFHAVYVARGPIGVHQRGAGALRVCPPGAFLSHATAAALWGGVAPDTSETHVTVPPDSHRSKRQGIVAHQADGVRPVRHRGLPVSSPTRAFVEVASTSRNLIELVVLGDSLVAARRTTPGELVEAADTYTGRGAHLARRAAALVRPGVDSPTETRLRLLIVLGGLPEPEVNRIVRHDDGAWRRRFDLSYPGHRLIVEYDGRQHVDVRAQWAADLKRREELERDGWTLVVITGADLFGDPEGTLERIRRALADRGCRTPRRAPAQWYRLFAPINRAAA